MMGHGAQSDDVTTSAAAARREPPAEQSPVQVAPIDGHRARFSLGNAVTAVLGLVALAVFLTMGPCAQFLAVDTCLVLPGRSRKGFSLRRFGSCPADASPCA